MPTIIDGTAGITFPNSTVQASAGQVLQVVQAVLAPSNVSTTSTSFVTSGFSASITPKFNNSKILVALSGGGGYAGSGQSNYVTLFRNNATNLGNATYGFYRAYAGSTDLACPYSIQFLDSPASTLSTTYTPYFRASTASGSTFHASDNGTMTLTLMEIAG